MHLVAFAETRDVEIEGRVIHIMSAAGKDDEELKIERGKFQKDIIKSSREIVPLLQIIEVYSG